MHPAGLSLPRAYLCLRVGCADGGGGMRAECGRRGLAGRSTPKYFPPGCLEGGVRTFSSPAGPQVTVGPGLHVTGGGMRRAAADHWAGTGPGGSPAPSRASYNWRQLRWRSLRCAAVWGGGVRAAAAMATVREKAAALNLTAFQSPAQRPPSRCRGPGLGTLGVTGGRGAQAEVLARAGHLARYSQVRGRLRELLTAVAVRTGAPAGELLCRTLVPSQPAFS